MRFRRLNRHALIVLALVAGFGGVASVAAATWTTKAPIPNGGRASFGYAKSPSGALLVIGGTGDGDIFDGTTVSAYSEASNTWSTLAPLPHARDTLGAGTVSGHVYAVGGCGLSGSLAVVEAYDESTDHWALRAPLPAPRCAVQVAVSRGRLYALGGFGADNLARRSVFAYNPSTNRWRVVAPLPTLRVGFTTAVDSHGSIYAIGGACCGARYSGGPPGSQVGRVDRYDPETNTWTRRAHMPAPRFAAAARRSADGRIFVFGGATFTDPDGDVVGTRTVQVYDPAANTWSRGPELPSTFGAGTYSLGALLGDSGALYAMGGRFIEHEGGCCWDAVAALQ